jgi:hypothetical protein
MDDLRQAWEQDGHVVLRDVAPTEQIAAYARELVAERDCRRRVETDPPSPVEF